jgi:adenosylmethionine-8-amino-7-oxononanoate aminotransferase
MNKRAESAVTHSTALEASAFWMPYTANRQFKKAPRMLARAEGMYYWTAASSSTARRDCGA